jgi:hypothetical protein
MLFERVADLLTRLMKIRAQLHWLSGDSQPVLVEVWKCLHGVAAWFAVITVLIEAYRMQRFWIGVAIAVGFLSTNFYEIFLRTHDTGWHLGIVSFLWLGATRVWRNLETNSVDNSLCGRWTWLGWGLSGGFIALSSPVLGIAWGALTFLPVVGSCTNRKCNQNKTIKKRLTFFVLSSFLAVLVVTPWTARNYLVLGTLVPIKSNTAFEFWQSQCVDSNGVLDETTLNQHPRVNPDGQRKRYAEIGEIRYVEELGLKAQKAVKDAPMLFVEKVANRLTAACLYYSPFSPSMETTLPWPLFLGRLLFPLPFASVIVLAVRNQPLVPQMKVAIAIYVLVLIPYVIASYYDRYAAPLVGIKSLLLLYGVDTAIHGFFAPWRQLR